MQRYRLDEDAARRWLTETILATESTDLDSPYPSDAPPLADAGSPTASTELPLGLAWRPSEPGQEDLVSELIRQAQDQAHVLIGPPHTQITITFLDDGADWAYQFVVELNEPVQLRLAGDPHPTKDLGVDLHDTAGATQPGGLEAALILLRQASDTGNALLDQLATYRATADPSIDPGRNQDHA
jgi:hypothetical protein